MFKLKQNEKEQREMSENLGNAYSTIDSLELLNKTEDALKYDIRTLMKQKNQLELFLAQLQQKIRKLSKK